MNEQEAEAFRERDRIRREYSSGRRDRAWFRRAVRAWNKKWSPPFARWVIPD